MRTYLISYDLAKPHLIKHVVAQAIMAAGQSWARPLEQTWYVRSEESEEALEAKLGQARQGCASATPVPITGTNPLSGTAPITGTNPLTPTESGG